MGSISKISVSPNRTSEILLSDMERTLIASPPVLTNAASTPSVKKIPPLQYISSTPMQEKSKIKKSDPSECAVSVQIEWKTKTKRKILTEDISSLGKMLCRGTYKQIARAAWRCKPLQKHFLEEIAKQIHKECSSMCSKGIIKTKKGSKHRTDSCLRKTDKASLLRFSFENLDNELRERAPLFQLVLKAASLRLEDKDKAWMTSVGTAAAVCLKNRSKGMTAVQLLISLINRHSGFMVRYSAIISESSYQMLAVNINDDYQH